MNTNGRKSENLMEKEWLERNRYYGDLDESKLTSIFYFPLIWNLFEKQCCGGNANINTHSHELAVQHAYQCANAVNQAWSHFQTRYIKDSKPTTAFATFTFKLNDNKQWVEAILRLNDDASVQEKMEALLRIIFRLRNNLYHGEKDVGKLYEQNENFRQSNQFLMALIDANKGK